MAETRLIGSYPVIGIRPTIDGRRGKIKVRESLEDQTMNMAKSAAKLIEENVLCAVEQAELSTVSEVLERMMNGFAVLLLDNSAADVMRETYADMLVAIDDFDTAMLKPGLVAHVQGRRVLALDGFEAALTDKAAKQRMWAYIKQLTPAVAPL